MMSRYSAGATKYRAGKVHTGSARPDTAPARRVNHQFGGLGADALRILAWVLVVWGVAIWATWGAYFLMGIATADKLVSTGLLGGIFVAVGYWLERNTRRKPPDQQGSGKSSLDSEESGASPSGEGE
jgi:hypothetical protein